MSKSSRVFVLAAASCLAMSVAAAAEFPAAVYKAADAPYSVSFDGKGQFHVDQGEKSLVKGTYTVKADELQLTDVSGPWACTQKGDQVGRYRWKLTGGMLMLSYVADPCADRVNSLVNIKWQGDKTK